MKLSDIKLFDIQIGDREWDTKLTNLLKKFKRNKLKFKFPKVKRLKGYIDYNTYSKVVSDKEYIMFISNTCIDSYNNLKQKEALK